MWDNLAEGRKIREYETKGSFGMAVDLVRYDEILPAKSCDPKAYMLNWFISIMKSIDGRFTASGHENGGVYIFNNDSGRLLHSLPGKLLLKKKSSWLNTLKGLVKPVRCVAFSPGGKLLAAAGDARVIALYDVSSGDQVANLTGHSAWIFSLDWSFTGEYLLSG